MNTGKFNKIVQFRNPIWLIISAFIIFSAIDTKAEIEPSQNIKQSQSIQISQKSSTNQNQVETEVREFISAWGEAWSPKEKTAEFTRTSIEPFYLQSEELLGFDFTDAKSRTVFKGVQIHHNTWEAFVRSYDYWTFTPVTASIRVYPQSDNAAAATLYVDNYGRKPDGTEFNARAHATLLLEKQDGSWVIVHENIWGPVNE
ncbi:MAG: hypothetical protein QNJ34_13855 [Xenococcaceae cyanobacterium MO_188.B29]|nr:hypothetical protein [Xenococcaceae cyanobacterium MO_188.B29]